jgi:hypothetical protein
VIPVRGRSGTGRRGETADVTVLFGGLIPSYRLEPEIFGVALALLRIKLELVRDFGALGEVGIARTLYRTDVNEDVGAARAANAASAAKPALWRLQGRRYRQDCALSTTFCKKGAALGSGY